MVEIGIWDIQDRAPVVIPYLRTFGDDRDKFERAASRMPPHLVARYYRMEATTHALMKFDTGASLRF